MADLKKLKAATSAAKGSTLYSNERIAFEAVATPESVSELIAVNEALAEALRDCESTLESVREIPPNNATRMIIDESIKIAIDALAKQENLKSGN